MVAPRILSLYASVWEPLLSSELTGHGIIEFSKKLPKLRSALSCCVCDQLLTNKEVLLSSGCREHFACKACVGKYRVDNRKCKRCDDWSTFVEDESLIDIIKSYQDFCYFFLTSEHIVRILEIKHEVDFEFDTFQLIDLVKEGLKGLTRLKKRKLSDNACQNKGVVPLDIARKIRKTKTVDNNSIKNEQSQLQIPNIGEKKVDAKRAATEDAQDKIGREKVPCDVANPNHGKGIPLNTTTPKPLGPVKCGVTLNAPNGAGPSALTANSTLKPIEHATSGVKSPPLVTIKVEVQTTPEKPQIDGNESSSSLGSTLPLDPLQDSISIPSEQQPKPLPKPMLTFTRPVMTNVVSQAPGSSMNTPSTIPYRITPTSVVSSQPSSQYGHQIIQIAHQSGIKTVSIRPQQFRLSSIPGRIPVQILGTATGVSTSGCTADNTRPPIFATAQIGTSATTTAPAVKRRIIFTTATPHDLQRWPDTSKVLQFATGDLSRFPALAGIRPNLISVGQTPCQVAGIRTTSVTSNMRPVATASTLPLVRPPNTTTVLTTSSSQVSQAILTPNASQGSQTQTTGFPFVRTVVPTTASSVGCTVRPQCFAVSATTVARQVPVSSPSTISSPVVPPKRKSEGCKCGNATPTPGKLTCIGQRCACYADRNACSDCKCKGCKNPYVPGSGGRKVFHGARALIDPQTNQTIPIIATPIGPGSSSATILSANSNSASTNPSLVTAVGSTSFGTLQTGVPSSTSQPVPPFQFIPVRFGNSNTPQYLQITNPQALQQMPIILSTSGHLQGNSTGITIQGIPVSGLSAGGLHIQQPRITQLNVKSERNPEQQN